MVILILIDVQYSHKAVFSFEKGSNGQNHISLGFLYLVKNLPYQNFRSPHPLPPPSDCYLENPGHGA